MYINKNIYLYEQVIIFTQPKNHLGGHHLKDNGAC